MISLCILIRKVIKFPLPVPLLMVNISSKIACAKLVQGEAPWCSLPTGTMIIETIDQEIKDIWWYKGVPAINNDDDDDDDDGHDGNDGNDGKMMDMIVFSNHYWLCYHISWKWLIITTIDYNCSCFLFWFASEKKKNNKATPWAQADRGWPPKTSWSFAVIWRCRWPTADVDVGHLRWWMHTYTCWWFEKLFIFP